jgi:Topoisomerase IA
VGHIRDLPKSRIGVNIDEDFKPDYIPVRGKAAVIKELKKKAEGAGRVLLASDPDREGEAIAWHLAHLLSIDPKTPCRIRMFEITAKAVKESVKNPKKLTRTGSMPNRPAGSLTGLLATSSAPSCGRKSVPASRPGVSSRWP